MNVFTCEIRIFALEPSAIRSGVAGKSAPLDSFKIKSTDFYKMTLTWYKIHAIL